MLERVKSEALLKRLRQNELVRFAIEPSLVVDEIGVTGAEVSWWDAMRGVIHSAHKLR
jgi:hypothetical protein